VVLLNSVHLFSQFTHTQGSCTCAVRITDVKILVLSVAGQAPSKFSEFLANPSLANNRGRISGFGRFDHSWIMNVEI